MLILFEMEGSKLTSAFYFYSDYLFFIYFVLKDSLPIRAEAFFFFFALNQPRERLAATGSRALTMQ